MSSCPATDERWCIKRRCDKDTRSPTSILVLFKVIKAPVAVVEGKLARLRSGWRGGINNCRHGSRHLCAEAMPRMRIPKSARSTVPQTYANDACCSTRLLSRVERPHAHRHLHIVLAPSHGAPSHAQGWALIGHTDSGEAIQQRERGRGSLEGVCESASA